MTDIILFGGTWEGRMLADFLGENDISSMVSVVSEYGASLLSGSQTLKIRSGVLPREEMKELFQREMPRLVVDATHPYASHISRTIQDVCCGLGIKHVSVKREGSPTDGYMVFEDLDQMIDHLNGPDRNKVVFSTLGAKSSPSLARIEGHGERVFTRILPSEESLHQALAAGIPPGHIICMQGPFSRVINEAMFRETRASVLLTKESGKAGGFSEKVRAADDLDMEVLILRRPDADRGVTVDEAKQMVLRAIE
ncbi:MAG: precorrin-6A reductase [Mobilibacterium timonense]|uniref:precorrin-6A reductase n=1 Tax=Mobilibacterium timonense TaxID=1871012 RepID=UPI002356BEE5|nr:precorrin-6A reductase [Mobilibacterium timonense]MBM6991161.1 precorrin-6A reductase [Mobilibacterium timonense]